MAASRRYGRTGNNLNAIGNYNFVFTSCLLFQIVHKWTPCHRELVKRSHVDKTIILLHIGERFVPIVETGTEIIKESLPSPPVEEAPPVESKEGNDKEADAGSTTEETPKPLNAEATTKKDEESSSNPSKETAEKKD